ncbi:hypothetical protein [Cellulomonas sp. URHE0023]|uniref:hypothetical protein n=1 Tax=Cellulomonas sp. URHE0023 TaxID=1380354 RepID=UPI00068D53D6|nr:hypothetical protein [Cellulomonas sp. URHE0023]
MASPQQSDVALVTYRHLRMVMVALPLLMFVASVGTFLAIGTIPGSISAYYQGPLRDVFVGMLVGLAACLVAYKGAPVEDYALDLAGFYALFVAFVPFEGYLESLTPDAVDTALVGVRIVTVSVLVVVGVFLLVEKRSGHWVGGTVTTRGWKARLFYRISQVMALAYLALLGYRTFIETPTTFEGIHLVSAFFLIISLTVAVATHGWPSAAGEETLPEPHLGWYRGLVLLMTVGVGVVFAVASWRWRVHRTLIIEWWEIVLFAVFWARETSLNWNRPPGAGAPELGLDAPR